MRAFELENETRKTLTQIILGIFGLLVLYITWRRVKAGDKTAMVAEQGHITERYTKAIEQLGKMENGEPNIEVRLGGIYALERIAIDSPRDQQTIMEVLCAYVRRNAVPPPAQHTTEAADGESPGSTPSAEEKLRIDIQAILTVIGRRQRGKHREKKSFQIDLSGAYLTFAHFYDAHLEGANLFDAQLEGANFSEAHLEQANLSFSRLGRAHFWRAHLNGANLEDAHLEEANGLTVEQVKSTKNWEHAHYDPEFRRQLGLPDQ